MFSANLVPLFRPSCIPDLYPAIRIGDAVPGVVFSTGGGGETTHLARRQSCSMSEWYAAAPRSFNEDGIQLPTDAIYKLPIIGYMNLPGHDGPTARMLFQPDLVRGVIADALDCPPLSPAIRRSLKRWPLKLPRRLRRVENLHLPRLNRVKHSTKSLTDLAFLRYPYRRLNGVWGLFPFQRLPTSPPNPQMT